MNTVPTMSPEDYRARVFPPQRPCPIHPGQWWELSYGYCSCGARHSQLDAPITERGLTPAP